VICLSFYSNKTEMPKQESQNRLRSPRHEGGELRSPRPEGGELRSPMSEGGELRSPISEGGKLRSPMVIPETCGAYYI
jgi:hypothetical protein